MRPPKIVVDAGDRMLLSSDGSQSRWGSLAEALINTFIGFALNFSVMPLVFWSFGWTINAKQNVAFVTIFTIISVLRGYCVRRWFNAFIKRLAKKITT